MLKSHFMPLHFYLPPVSYITLLLTFSNFFFPARMQVCVRLYFFSLPILDRDEEKGLLVAGALYEMSFFF